MSRLFRERRFTVGDAMHSTVPIPSGIAIASIVIYLDVGGVASSAPPLPSSTPPIKHAPPHANSSQTLVSIKPKKIEEKKENGDVAKDKIASLEKQANLLNGTGIDQLKLNEVEELKLKLERALVIAVQTIAKLKAENSNECKICMENTIDTVLLECGHQCCCRSCSNGLRNCPICRGTITRVIATFKS